MKSLLLILLLFTSTADSAEVSRLKDGSEQRFTQLLDIERSSRLASTTERAQAIESGYRQTFRDLSPAEINELTDTEIGFEFRGAYTALFYTRNKSYLEIMDRYLSELERRGTAQDTLRRDYYQALIKVRNFEEASKYKEIHRELPLERIPSIKHAKNSARGSRIYHAAPEKFELSSESIALNQGTHVIAVVHPLCTPSGRAIRDILNDRKTWKAMKGVTHWVLPQDTRLNFEQVQSWNRQNPEVEMVLTHDIREWPLLEDWSTPHFYLISDGKLIDKFGGWPLEGGNRERLLELLARGKLLPAQ